MNQFKESKTLIAYYSREGSNYAGGRIVNLPTVNKETTVVMIQKITGGKLLQIII
jgi:hypothetical protein